MCLLSLFLGGHFSRASNVIPVCLLQSVSRKSIANAYWRDGRSLGIPTPTKHARSLLIGVLRCHACARCIEQILPLMGSSFVTWPDALCLCARFLLTYGFLSFLFFIVFFFLLFFYLLPVRRGPGFEVLATWWRRSYGK
jgi:hypothetical protein